ncbi:DNA-directed RNA polymerase subunit delta [Tepidibacillus fermentans]|uniref:Probable DNA-directed RNA polymerase subunit delta n=2 Tax=Tepidibacillus fermentans TaxID=1281767 RepID=A0A4R3KHD1_9BACI|nr:DNA-directed RNA polymerase subunit delta [Tepidibacillus fermentans]
MSETVFDFDERSIQEKPMVDLAYQILKQAKRTFTYQELAQEVFKLKGLSEDELLDFTVQLFTEINIDGRFAYLGQNEWGLKQWYPVDQLESVHLRFNDDEDTDFDYDEQLEDEEYTDEDELMDDELTDDYDDTDALEDDFIDEDMDEFEETDEDDDLDLE